MRRFLSVLLALLLCAAAPLSMAEEEKSVVATFYPIYCMAANLLTDVPGVTLSSLTPPTTGCLHDQALLPADLQTLDAADVLLMNGAGMEAYLSDALSQFPALRTVDASEGIALLPAHEHEDHEEHDHGEFNAHVWMSVPNAMQMMKNLCEGLAQALPEQRVKLEENRDAYLARLETLDGELREGLTPYAGREIVTPRGVCLFCAGVRAFGRRYRGQRSGGDPLRRRDGRAGPPHYGKGPAAAVCGACLRLPCRRAA